MFPFSQPHSLWQGKRGCLQGADCKPTLRKDGTEATSAKAARLPSCFSQSGREDVENKCSSARRYRVARTECSCNFTTACTQLKCQDQAALLQLSQEDFLARRGSSSEVHCFKGVFLILRAAESGF